MTDLEKTLELLKSFGIEPKVEYSNDGSCQLSMWGGWRDDKVQDGIDFCFDESGKFKYIQGYCE